MAQFGKMVMLWPKIDVVSPPPFFSPGTLQYKEDVNLVTQIIAGNITNTKLIKNDPLLSGIIDVIFLQSNIVSELKMGNVFDDVNQGLSIDDLPGGLEEFNREYMNKNERYNIPEKYFESEFFDLFIACRNFVSHFIGIKKIRMYSRNEEILESTWSHDGINPITRLIFYDIYDLTYQWQVFKYCYSLFILYDLLLLFINFHRDNNMSEATRERNDDTNGPWKKPDLHGYIFGKFLNWEICYGEISNGPRKRNTSCTDHIKNDHNKLLKFAKDGWDKMINSFKNKPTDIRTIVEIFIVDRKYYPLHRARRLCCIYIPLDDNNESFTETIISLIRIVYSVNQRLKKSLNIINEIEQTSFQELHNIEKNDLVTILTYDTLPKALKIPGMCYSNGNLVLAEPNIPSPVKSPFQSEQKAQDLLTNQDQMSSDELMLELELLDQDLLDEEIKKAKNVTLDGDNKLVVEYNNNNLELQQ
ncbi:5947_t:CDS:2, partial [Entrophospora sp. SA101]